MTTTIISGTGTFATTKANQTFAVTGTLDSAAATYGVLLKSNSDALVVSGTATANDGVVAYGNKDLFSVASGGTIASTNADPEGIGSPAITFGGNSSQGVVLNSGMIAGSGSNVAINFDQTGGYVTNTGSGVIRGGIYATTATTITNAGTINGPSSTFGAIDLIGGGSVSNSGEISASAGYGIYISGAAGTVLNSGTISAPGLYAITLANYASNLVGIYKGSSITGTVNGGTGTLDLESSASMGTVSTTIDSSQFTNFSTLSFAAGADWSVATDPTFSNSASLVISDFHTGDTLNISGLSATPTTFASSVVSLASGTYNTYVTLQSGGTNLEVLQFTGSIAGAKFELTSPELDEEEIKTSICYVRGTHILTTTGEVPVEAVEAGQLVATRIGGFRPVKWIGRQSFDGRFLGVDDAPVRFKAGSLGPNLPFRDLVVSPRHSMLVDGTLVVARHLVNGITVLREPTQETVEYYQLDLGTHDCVLAEGAWSESFADGPGLRNQFHNKAEFLDANPDYVEPEDLEPLCAPRPMEGAAFETVVSQVAARAAEQVTLGAGKGFVEAISANGLVHGWAIDGAHPELPVLLDILVDGQAVGSALACHRRDDLRAAGIGIGYAAFRFELPEGADPLAVSVRRRTDGWMLPLSHDCREELLAA